ncbi:hypothetical protein SRHO_G00264800 [Serrasalmus rhombeus]
MLFLAVRSLTKWSAEQSFAVLVDKGSEIWEPISSSYSNRDERLGEVEWEVHHVLLDYKAFIRFPFSHCGRRLASWKPLVNNKTRARKPEPGLF